MNELLTEMRARVDADVTGKLLEEFVRERKEAGLQREEARSLLTELLDECNSVVPETPTVTRKIEAISNILDLVMGNANISEYLIYPKL